MATALTDGPDKPAGKVTPEHHKDVDPALIDSDSQVVKPGFDAAGQGAVRALTASERDRPTAEVTVLKGGFRSSEELLSKRNLSGIFRTKRWLRCGISKSVPTAENRFQSSKAITKLVFDESRYGRTPERVVNLQ